MDKKISISQLKEVAQEAYEQVKGNTGGKNADYIPYLANIDKNLFGISICLLDGSIIQLGDSEYRFGIESVSKVHTAVLALRQYGAQKLLQMIGADATGLPFNSIMAILLEKDHPSTPLVNAGAITACSMVQPVGDSNKKWEAIVSNITDLCGSAPQLIDELYKSESATNFNNRSIAWLLKNYNRIYDDPDMSLDLYTRQCSLGITAAQLSICGATIANDTEYALIRQRASGYLLDAKDLFLKILEKEPSSKMYMQGLAGVYQYMDMKAEYEVLNKIIEDGASYTLFPDRLLAYNESLKKTENVAQEQSSVPVPVDPAMLVIRVDSFIDGNNNKVIDAGESFAVQFTVENQGKGDAYNIRLRLSE